MAEDSYWKSLLAISTAATNESKENGVFQPRVLDEENRKWLEQVMKDLVKNTDPSVQLDNVMRSLHCYAAGANSINEEDVEKLEDLVNRLEDLLSFSFLTAQFVNNGGLVMIRQFLEKHSEVIRCMFAQCILTFTENNPPAQKSVIECGLLDYILNVLEQTTTGENEKIKIKFLGGVSGTVRSDEFAFESFIKINGHSILANLAKDLNMKIAAKSARVLTSIAYTLQDSEKFADFLLPQLVMSYNAIATRSRNHENSAELEYMRDFFYQYVSKEKLDDNLLKCIIEGLNKENEFKDEREISDLLKKYE